MDRRALAAVLLGVLLLAAPAAGDPGLVTISYKAGGEQAQVDRRLGEVRGRIAESGRQAGVLTSDLSLLAGRVREAERQIAAEEAALVALESELASRRATLAALAQRIEEQTSRLVVLGKQHEVAIRILEQRVRAIYMSDSPDLLSFVLETSSFADVLDNLELLQRIGRQDERTAERVRDAEDALSRVRAETRRDQAAEAEAERVVATRVEEQRSVRNDVLATRNALVSAQREKAAALASLRVDKQQFLQEAEALEGQRTVITQQIAAARAARAAATIQQSAAPPAVEQTVVPPAPRQTTNPSVNASGFIWPVNGTVTSGFGVRWGRMHEGVDIAAPLGTPVVAVAGGTVTEIGWHEGFGNLVVIDHGGGLETYYAHNSSFAVSAGTTVTRGQPISYVGTTGHSTGPHVHLEVHVNGVPVDPLGYLG